MFPSAYSYALFGGREPSTYLDRKGSRNAKYDSLLGNTYSLRTNRASKETLERLEGDIAKQKEERARQRTEDQDRLFKKLGIKAPTGMKGTKRHASEGDAVASLQRYKLGAQKPPWTTPGIGLSETLQNILYPQPPQSEPLWDQEDRHDQATYHSPQSFDSQGYPFRTPPMASLPPVPPNWFYSPQTGWYYVPPNQAHSSSSEMGSPFRGQPQSRHTPSGSDWIDHQQSTPSENPVTHPALYASPASPEPARLKSILKWSSSDPTHTPRQVRFRNTPEFAPSLSQASSISGLPDSTPLTTPEKVPRWTAHNDDPGSRKRSRSDVIPMNHGGDSHDDIACAQPDDTYVPATLRLAHRRLFDFDIDRPVASGKRRGKNLIAELERIAEAATNGREQIVSDSSRDGVKSEEAGRRHAYEAHRPPAVKHKRANGISTPKHSGNNGTNSDPRRPPPNQDLDRAEANGHTRFGREQFHEDDTYQPDYSHSPSPDVPESTYDLRNGTGDVQRGSQDQGGYREARANGDTDHAPHGGSQLTPSPLLSHNSKRPRHAFSFETHDRRYRESPIPELVDQSHFHHSDRQDFSRSPAALNAGPEPKRIRLTERAWRYEVPKEKLPPTSPPKGQPKARSRRVRAPIVVKTERPSQSSQIEVSDEGDEHDRYMSSQHDETIDGSWPASQGGRLSQNRLDTIHEGDNEVTVKVYDFQPLEQDRWVDRGFFQDGGGLGFKIWRDAY